MTMNVQWKCKLVFAQSFIKPLQIFNDINFFIILFLDVSGRGGGGEGWGREKKKEIIPKNQV